MGKGKNGCDGGMAMSSLIGEDETLTFQPPVEEVEEADFSPYGAEEPSYEPPVESISSILADIDSELEEMHMSVFEETARASEVEEFEKSFAQSTLDQARALFEEGADQDEVDAFFRERELERVAERTQRLRNYQWPEGEEVDYEAGMSVVAQLAARRTYVHLGDPNDAGPPPAALRFQEEFMNSDDFQRHLRNLLAEDTTSQLAAGAVAGKEMEDVYRAATLRTIGISEGDPTQTIGRWASPDGTEYQIEVMREFSGSAMIDLIMLAREVGADHGEVYSMQWKSYQTNDTITNDPTPGRSRNSRAIRIDRLTDIPGSIMKNGSDEEVVMEAIRTAQLRLLATNTFADTSSFKQNARIEKDGEQFVGRADWITYVTRMSRPEVHKAVTQADPAKLLADARITSKGKVVIPVATEIEGKEVTVEIQTGLTGKKFKSGPRKGRIELNSRQDSKIGIHIPIKGWRQAHAVAAPSVIRAGAWMRAGKKHGAHTIEALDGLIPHFDTDFRGQ